jgi:hypothetical protein
MNRIKAAIKRALDGYFNTDDKDAKIIRDRVEDFIHAELEDEGWISVKDRLPVIPKGKYGIPVLVAEFDHVYEEINPTHGYAVRCKSYGKLRKRDGELLPHFAGTTLEEDFMDLHIGGEHGASFGPCADEITHWQYLPAPPIGVPE